MMNIHMLGIDHSTAAVGQREKFSFTKTRVTEAVQRIAALDGVNGCVMISTCNRMEVYISTQDGVKAPVYQTLCALKGLPEREYRDYFVSRSGLDAVYHLFALAAGMKSRIVGEDQIIMQVKEALSLAREADCTDKVMEVLFRMAVTSGKKVKTDITFHKANSSAISSAVDSMKAKGFDFSGKRCLVIGNGEMGKLTANAMRAQGADVTVTVRQYRSGVVQIPAGCHRINYGERYDIIPECDIIVSATASPNLTLRREDIESLGIAREQIYLDLAVPRDIDPGIRAMKGAELYDIDSFASGPDKDTVRQIEEANAILREGIDEFTTWYECKDLVPRIQSIGRAAAGDIVWRTGKAFGEVEIDDETREHLERSIELSSAKVVSRLLFSLRDSADPEILRTCIEAFSAAYSEEKR